MKTLTTAEFRKVYPWIPEHDQAGHQLGPGLVSFSFSSCSCPAATDGRGHHVAYCRVNGCRAAPARPPGCPGPAGAQKSSGRVF